MKCKNTANSCMKIHIIRYLLIILLSAFTLSSCHSHRNVVRGADKDIKETAKIEKKVDAPKLSGSADNKFTKSLLNEAYEWLGVPYKYGGNNKNGVDCSGFVLMVFHKALSIDLPRVSREQGDYCRKINKKDLFPGDLLFFAIGKSNKVNHVGMYVGDGKMIHASASKGVMISDVSEKYFEKYYHHSGQVESYHKMLKNSNKKEQKKKEPAKKSKPAKEEKVSPLELPMQLTVAVDTVPPLPFE